MRRTLARGRATPLPGTSPALPFGLPMTRRCRRANDGAMEGSTPRPPRPRAAPPSVGAVTLTPVPGVGIARAGDDLGLVVADALSRAGLEPAPGDVLVVASKLVSRCEGRFVRLPTVEPTADALALADRVQADPRLVTLVLRESVSVSRAVPGALIVRHRLGFVSANAGIDLSNARPGGAEDGSPEGPDDDPWALLLPADPDASAARLREALAARFGTAPGVIVSDSLGRPFRLGSMGTAIGVAGLVALWDHRGRADLFGRPLEHTETAIADQIACAADLVAGQADEGRPVILVRGLLLPPGEGRSADLLRPLDRDLYA